MVKQFNEMKKDDEIHEQMGRVIKGKLRLPFLYINGK